MDQEQALHNFNKLAVFYHKNKVISQKEFFLRIEELLKNDRDKNKISDF